jgi:hypothetical protein
MRSDPPKISPALGSLEHDFVCNEKSHIVVDISSGDRPTHHGVNQKEHSSYDHANVSLEDQSTLGTDENIPFDSPEIENDKEMETDNPLRQTKDTI